MYGVAGEKHPTLAVAVGQEQVHPPLPDIEHVVFDRHGDDLLEHARHVGVGPDNGMQREMPGRVLHDQETAFRVCDVIMPALADGHALVEIFAIIKRLSQLLDVGLAVELDAELAAHQTVAAVAADHVRGAQRGGGAVAPLDLRRDRILILLERHELATVADADARQRLSDRFQERLERVLRDELVGLEREAAVLGFGDLHLRLRHRRMGMVHQRRLDQRQHDEDVHRTMGGKAGGANLVDDAHAPVDLHGTGVAALHLRKKLRGFLLLDDDRAYAAQSEVDGERQAGGARSDDENLCVHGWAGTLRQSTRRLIKWVRACAGTVDSVRPNRSDGLRIICPFPFQL
jgi:hypothetical protein